MNIFSLPIDLIRGRILPLLSLVDTVCLDSSVLNRELRPHIIDAFSGATLAKDADVLAPRAKLVWLSKRKIHCKFLEFGLDLVDGDICKYSSVLTKVEHIRLQCCQDFCGIGMANLMNQCHSLTKLEIINCVDFTYDNSYDMLFQSNNLAELHFINCRAFEDDAFCYIIQFLPWLEVVNISGCTSLTNEVVETMTKSCPDLREFYLKDMPWESFTADCLDYIAEHCPKFEKLVCHRLDELDKQLVTLAKGCPLLSSLDLGECEGVSDETILGLSNHCPNLHTCVVNDCNLSDVAVSALLQRCPKLTTFAIDSAFDLTVTSLSALTTQGGVLTSLHLGNFPELPPELFISIIASCKQLHTLEIPCCDLLNDAVLLKIAECCVDLKQLDISEVTGYSDSALITLFQSLTELEVLTMNHHVVKGCVLEQIGASCRKLYTLSLTSSMVANEGLQLLAKGCSSLAILRVANTLVDDAGLVPLLTRNKNLIELDVSGCNVADRSMKTISRNCLQLRKLYLDSCPNITSAGFGNLTFRCNQLREVWMCDNKWVINKVILALARNCRYLHTLRVNRCLKLTDSILGSLRKHSLYLRRIEFGQCSPSFTWTNKKFYKFHTAYNDQLVVIDALGDGDNEEDESESESDDEIGGSDESDGSND